MKSLLMYERTSPVAHIQLEFIDSDMFYYLYSDGCIDKSVHPISELPDNFGNMYYNTEMYPDWCWCDESSHDIAAFNIAFDDPEFDEKVKKEIIKLINE